MSCVGGQHYLDRTAAHRLRCERLFVTAGRSKKEISKTTLLLAPEDNITCLPALGYGTACSCPSSSGDSWYCSASSFQEELLCRPGVEGGYVVLAYHLYAPLLEGHRSSVPRHIPPGPCGGGTGLGLTLA